MEEHFSGKIAQKALIEKDGKVLITRADPDIWELPGGRLNKDEQPKDGLKRELKEELGVETDIGDVIHVEQYLQTYNGEPHILLAYKAHLLDSAAQFHPDPKEVLEMKWIDASQLGEQKIYDNCLRALQAYFGVR